MFCSANHVHYPATEDYTLPGFPNPTGPVKPPPSGSGLSDRFDRKPVEFKSKFKIACATGSDRYTGHDDRFTGRYDRFVNFYFFEFKFKF